MHRLHLSILLLLLLTAAGAPLRAQQKDVSFEEAAEKLQAATVTVRVARRNATADKVTVFTGVSIGDGIVVTPLFTPDDMRIRITMPGGGQADATPRVLDEHSGLALLEIDAKQAPGLALAEDAPKVGAWVLSGAGWGVEKAVVSLGIVSGIDRSLPGANYPPLLQCDLRTASTSSGAAVINNRGELLGVVIAAQSQQEGRRGWTYAVPVRHVQRLLRALAERKKAASSGEAEEDNHASRDGVVVLKPRRPVVGMVLGPVGDGDVVVKKVTGSGPAEKAGIRQGDEILAADGIEIRSVYQAVRPLLYKQPGDVMQFLVRNPQGEVRSVKVVLGGGVLLPSAPSVKLANLIEPKVIVSGQTAPHVTRRGAEIAEVAVGQDGDAQAEGQDSSSGGGPTGETIAALQQKIRLQEKALDRYRSAIAAQQAQIAEALQDRLKTEEELLQLQDQVEQLSKKLQQATGNSSSP
jgi:S1-C subfamily serine protease